MSGREWKSGDVALLMTEGGERIGFRCGVPTNMGWQYAREPAWSSDSSGYVKPIRPLVVIDPEDREQVERLVRLFWDNGTDDCDDPLSMQAALCEFASPTPPKPEEPTGLGAVVEDGAGVRWLRRYPGDHQIPWASLDTTAHKWRHRDWFEVDAVRVLSEGVQP